jgi:hypothetical protein
MAKKIKVEDDWDPDKFRDDLCRRRWIESGATTYEEYVKWHTEKLRKFQDDVKASGLSYGEYMIAFKTAQELAQTNAENIKHRCGELCSPM